MYLKHCIMVSNLDVAKDGELTNLQTLLELLLLLVYYTEAKVYLIGLLEARVHAHDL